MREDTECIMLTKLKPALITGENFGKVVRFVPVSSSPMTALYQTIHSVFTPLFQK